MAAEFRFHPPWRRARHVHLLCFSGVEPLLRIFAEAGTLKRRTHRPKYDAQAEHQDGVYATVA